MKRYFSRWGSGCMICMLLAVAGCNIGEDSPVREFYSFDISADIDPIKKEYLKGDVFWLEVDIPGKQLTDITTGKAVEVGNATFNVALNVVDPLDNKPGLEKFEIISQSGVVSNAANFKKDGSAILSFGCPANNYYLYTGIQFTEKGGYVVYLNKLQPYFQIVFTQDDDCSQIPPNTIPPDNADIGTVHLTFALDDTNKDKFEEYAALFPDTTEDLAAIRTALDKKEAFFVWVK